jgi:iron complex outermembrane receptor protein
VQKIFVILLLLVTISFSQKRVVVIDSSSKEPISDVVVYSNTTRQISDKDGLFFLKGFEVDDSISFSHISYIKRTLSFSELEKLSQIELIRKKISTEEVNVVSQSNYENSIINENIELNKHDKNSFASTSEILKSKTSLLIRDYGGEGSTKTVSSRGMSSENTLVLFNEARVNDLRTGSFDFSLLDIFAIDKIEYVKNNSADNITAGGVLKITSENLKNENSASLGTMFNSNLTQKYFGSVNYSKSNISFGSNFARSYSPNEYNYDFEGEELKRKNAQYSKTFINGDLKWSSNNLVLKLYTHYSHLLNGLPGYVVTNNTASSKAINLTNSWLSIGNINYSISKNTTFLSTISYHNQYLQMVDPQNRLLIDRDSQSSTFKDLSFSSKLAYKFNKLNFLFGYNISNSSVDSLTTYITGIFSSNTGDRTEQNFHTSADYFISSKYFEKLNFSGGVNYQLVNENIYNKSSHNYLSYKLGISFTPLFSDDLEVLTSFSSNYRHPTFNEKYYSGFFGNSELKGEVYKSINIGINYKSNLFSKEEIGITYFSIWGDNKIIWAPTILAIQIPRNISKIKSDGIEFSFKQSLLKSLFNWELLYTYTNVRNISALSEDDNTYNKQIIYTPLHRLNVNGVINISSFRLSANTSFIGKRYFTPDNTERNSLQPYFLLDLSVSYTFNIATVENTITINGHNILDEVYFVIQSYPMPLKTISINYQARL